MEPTLRERDLLLVDRQAHVQPGLLVVITLPDGTPAVKRVAFWHAEEPAGWWVERDNPRAGVDSWAMGAIAPGAMLGVVRARLWPRPRLWRAVVGG
jgi:hypothetical protein